MEKPVKFRFDKKGLRYSKEFERKFFFAVTVIMFGLWILSRLGILGGPAAIPGP